MMYNYFKKDVEVINMEKNTCEFCRFFYQHYIRLEEKYAQTNCGHCVYPRIKHRKMMTPACAYFEKRGSDAAAASDV